MTPKYDIGFVVKNCNEKLLALLEPWCSTIYIEYTGVIESYIKEEQKNTEFDLKDRIKHYVHQSKTDNDIIIEAKENSLLIFNGEVIHSITNMPKILGNKNPRYSIVMDFNYE